MKIDGNKELVIEALLNGHISEDALRQLNGQRQEGMSGFQDGDDAPQR